MATHSPLYLTSDGLRWYRSDAGQPRLIRRFAASDEGVAEFAAALQSRSPAQAFSILVDVADEGFNLDHVPAIHGRDRNAMLQRKLAQQFYGSPYSAALSLGREKDGRRDERMLFSALTRPVQIEPWVNALIAAEARVKGVHSAPFVLDRIMARAKVPARSYLLVNFSPAGTRQTYFSEGRLRFSRLAGVHDQDFARQLQTSAEEIRKTLAYLSAQRLAPRGEVLPIIAMVGASQFDAFRDCVAQLGDVPVSLAEIGRLRGAYGSPDARGDSLDSLPVLLDALLAETLCTQIGGTPVLRFQRLHQIRRSLYLASLAVLTVGGLSSAYRLFENMAIHADIDNLQQLSQAEELRYRRLIDGLPPLPAPLDELRSLVGHIDRLAVSAQPALSVVRPLALTLDEFPEIELEKLQWRNREEPAAAGDVSSSSSVAGVVATASLRLPANLAGDPRGMLEASQRFADQLAMHSKGRVRLLRRPVDIQSSQTLRGREAESAPASTARAGFELEFELPAEQPA